MPVSELVSSFALSSDVSSSVSEFEASGVFQSHVSSSLRLQSIALFFMQVPISMISLALSFHRHWVMMLPLILSDR